MTPANRISFLLQSLFYRLGLTPWVVLALLLLFALASRGAEAAQFGFFRSGSG